MLYIGPREAAAAANWLISIHKFVGPGRIPLRGSESTEITMRFLLQVSLRGIVVGLFSNIYYKNRQILKGKGGVRLRGKEGFSVTDYRYYAETRRCCLEGYIGSTLVHLVCLTTYVSLPISITYCRL